MGPLVLASYGLIRGAQPALALMLMGPTSQPDKLFEQHHQLFSKLNPLGIVVLLTTVGLPAALLI
jgi:hypothetical protein